MNQYFKSFFCFDSGKCNSCPWLKTSLDKYNPTKSKLWPCDLLMVIAKEKIFGNYRLTSSNGHGDYEGDIYIIGIYVIFPVFFLEMIFSSIT